ncbi:MAG TPA: hypothetical protein VMT34_04950 [Aggregatilineales bacterium]|nr:hypothetical protein [Aggregatilineales bacterium]
MSGKVVVVVILLAAAGLLIFSLWYLGSKSPIDQRFALNRTPAPLNGPTIVPDYGAADKLLPGAVGDFARFSEQPFNLSALMPHAEGVYGAGSGRIRLTIDRIPSGESASAAVQAVLPKQNSSTVIAHSDAKYPFAYVQPSGEGLQSQLIWANGAWLLTASAEDVDPEVLLLFANSYPY